MAGFRSKAAGLSLALCAGVTLAGVVLAQTGSAPAAASSPVAVSTKPAPLAAPAVKLPEKNQWKDLSAVQKVALAPMAAEWDHLDSVRKLKWLDIANRYAGMKPDEQQRVQERMRDWLKLTPEERRVARENYTLSKKIDKEKKSAQWEQYQQLPEEEKKKLAADAASKKNITNLPPKTQQKAVTPIKEGKQIACLSGTIKNPNAGGPACIPAPAKAAMPPVTTPAPLAPAVPVPNAK